MKNFLKGRKLKGPALSLSKGRYLLLGGLFLTAAFLAIPQHVFAQWYLNALSSIFSPLISGALKLLLKLAGLLLGWMTQLVGWAIGNIWNISYTRPGSQAPDNFIIEIGWTLLRDLVNMGFILGLAYIGLATALDLGNQFNTKITFRNLILIALLINFTPAICGAVVDIGNILGSFFTQGTDFSALNDIFNRQQGKINAVWADILTDNAVLLNTVALIIFGFASAFILFIYALFFIARGPIIWVLVILSPIAFFAFIFDKTRKQFDRWWDFFIQWALLTPITLGFFLYLSQQMLVRVNEIMNAGGSSPTGIINQLMPYTLPVGALALGLLLGTANLIPKGGAAVLGAATALGTGSIIATGAVVKGASSLAGKGIRAAGSGIKGVGSGIGMAGDAAMRIPYVGGVVGTGMKVMGAGIKTVGSGVKATGSAVKTAGAAAGSGVKTIGRTVGKGAESGIKALGIGKGSTQAQTGLESAITGLQGTSAATQQTAMNNALPGVEGRLERIAATIAAIKDGNGQILNSSDRESIIQDTIKLAPEQMAEVKNIDPETTAQIINKIKPSEQSQKQMGVFMTKEEIAKFSGHQGLLPLAAKLMAEIKPNQMNAWTKNTANMAAISGIVNKFWGGAQVAKAAELFGSKFTDAFRKNVKSKSYYEQNNKAMGSFIGSSAGRASGLEFRKDESQPIATKQQAPPPPAPPPKKAA